MKKITLVVAPLLAISFLTSCNKKITAPGREINIVEATQWVSDHFDKRVNLAKSAIAHVALDSFSCNGMIYPTVYSDPVPIDDPTHINLKVTNEDFATVDYFNVAGVVGSFITVNGYRPDPIVKSSDYMPSYLLNPFMDSFEIGYVETLKQYVDKGAFETRYTLNGENLYITYHFNDLGNVTKAIEEVSIQYPEMTFAIPFTGTTGSVSLIFGFDKYGYPIEMRGDINSDDLAVHLGLTGGQINTTFFTGAMHGKVRFTNKITLYKAEEYPHINFREIKNGQVIEPTYTTRGVNDQEEAHNTGTALCETIAVELKDYYKTILPGYGTNIVIPDHTGLKISIDYKGVSYPISGTSSSVIQTIERNNNTLIHFYPESFALFEGGNVNLDVQIGG